MKKLRRSAFKVGAAIFLVTLFSQCNLEEEEIVPMTIQEPAGAAASTLSAECGCDHVVDRYAFDGREQNVKPGDVICLDASRRYNRILFTNIVGTAAAPVVVQNCGGVAKIYSTAAFGIKFENSKHLKLTGTGSSSKYGIKVTTEAGFFVTMEKFTTNFEISNIEVAGPNPKGLGDRAGFAGIGVKTSPYQACDVFDDPTRTAWIMRDVVIRDNYIHDTGGEGLYVGHGFYKGRKEAGCSRITYSHSIKGVLIENNLIKNVGYDGIQIKNADHDVIVRNNVIQNYGTKNASPHNEGLFIGEGTTGKFYNNYINTGSGNGIMVHGIGGLKIFNNVIARAGDNGIFASEGAYVVRWPTGKFFFANNTICDIRNGYAFLFYGDSGGEKTFANNYIVNAPKNVKGNVKMLNNLQVGSVSLAGFVDHRTKDFRLATGSKAINAGYSFSDPDLYGDFNGRSRPRGGKFDIGAFEY